MNRIHLLLQIMPRWDRYLQLMEKTSSNLRCKRINLIHHSEGQFLLIILITLVSSSSRLKHNSNNIHILNHLRDKDQFYKFFHLVKSKFINFKGKKYFLGYSNYDMFFGSQQFKEWLNIETRFKQWIINRNCT